MSFSLNPLGVAQHEFNSSRVDFINKYGTLASKYDRLNALGEQKNKLFYFLPLALLILSMILFAKSIQKKDADNKPIERTSDEKLLRNIAWIVFIGFILSTGYGGYMYFILYMPQYNKWFNELPFDAKEKLNLINTLDLVVGSSRTNTTANRNPALFNIL